VLAVSIVLVLLLAGVTSSGAVVAEGSSRSLSFVALGCEDFAQVPAALRASPVLDETAGGYLDWGPALGPVTTAPDLADPAAGCRPLDGVGFRASAVPGGATLAAQSPRRIAAGDEDGVLTAAIGATANGRLEFSATELPPALQEALVAPGAEGGLWVSTTGLPGRFAGFRCHRDQTNGDNLEVIRLSGADAAAVCVVYAVGAPAPLPSPAPPVSPVPPAPPPSPAPVEPATPPASALGPATPPASAPATQSPALAGDPPAAPLAEPTAAAIPPASLQPAPAPALPPASPPPGPVTAAPTTAPSAPTRVDPLAVPSQQPGPAAVPTPRQTPEEEAAFGPAGTTASLEIIVEVGGVTRGSPRQRITAARTPWVRPIEVDLRCPEERPRILSVAVGAVPGAQVRSGPLPTGSGADACVLGLAEDGIDGDAGLVRVQLGERTLAEGQYTRVDTDTLDTQVLRVHLTYGSSTDDGAARESAASSPRPASGGVTWPLSVALSAAALAGLAGAVAASWRGQRPPI
jgi:hypothetical protein